MTDVEEVLKDIKKELTENGTIQHDLLVWGMKIVASFDPKKHKMFFFGIKDKKFMILPMTDIKTVHYDEVKYYAKDEIDLGFSMMRSDIFKISVHGKTDKYNIMGPSGHVQLKKIIEMMRA